MDTLARVAQFFAANGRDFDKARFAYHFADGSCDEIMRELGKYQNPDGGFHGLEVDIKAPDSNPFATELALQACLQADVPRDHAVLQKVTDYLERTQDEDGGWRFSAGVYQHELAPWFQGWTWPSLNPTCTIAGLLRELGLGSDKLHAGVERLFQQMQKLEDVAGDGFYNVRSYAYYFLPEWQHPQREFYLAGVLWWIIRNQLDGKLPDGEHFFAYIRTPHTYTGKMMPRSLLNERLDALTAEQEEDGGWPSPYQPDWRPWTTMQNLLTLKAFGRI
jgi:Prenyltransferase and squalene oxidase repeat